MDTYVVSLVLLGKHSWKDGMGLKSGAAGSDVGRVRPIPFTEDDGTVAVILTAKERSPARRSTPRAWCITSELVPVPFCKIDFADASMCAEPDDFPVTSATAPCATRAAVVPLVIAIAMAVSHTLQPAQKLLNPSRTSTHTENSPKLHDPNHTSKTHRTLTENLIPT